MHRAADFDLPRLQQQRWQRGFDTPPIESAHIQGQLDGDALRTVETSSITPHIYNFERDGFALSAGPVLPQSVVARALVSFNAIVAAADAGEYQSLSGPKQPCDAPHVQEVVQNLASSSTEALRKVEMPQLDRTRGGGIIELMNHDALARWCRQAVGGVDWLQVWWIQLHGKPATATATPANGDGTSIGFHQDKNYWNSSFQVSEDYACGGSIEKNSRPAQGQESQIFTAWVALSEVGTSDGPMQLIRGSHLWGNGMLKIPAYFHHQNLETQRSVALRAAGRDDSIWDTIPAVLPSGGVSVHDWRCLHGSGPNNNPDGRMRCSLAIHIRTGRSWPKSKFSGELYLDQFLHDRRRNCCPVILGDVTAIKGDKIAPTFPVARSRI